MRDKNFTEPEDRKIVNRVRSLSKRRNQGRTGAAAIELAVLLPLLVFLFVIGTDFARVFYLSLTLTNCARSGALYASDPSVADESPYSSVEQAALADAANLSPKPTVASAEGLDEAGIGYVVVTVSSTFDTITKFPGVPSQIQLKRSVRMTIAPTRPNSN